MEVVKRKVGRPTSENARVRGPRVPISPRHGKIVDKLKVGTQSRSDVVEAAIEFWEQYLNSLQQ